MVTKKTIQIGNDTYCFSNNNDINEKGMLIEKNGETIGVYSHFKYSNKLDDNYLMELALEFETENF